MTNDDIWENNILESLEDLADIDNQRLSWMGLDSEQVSSFTEVLAMLYDNFDFHNFIGYHKTRYGESKIYFKLLELDELISNYQKVGYNLETEQGGIEKILYHPDWINITLKAKAIISRFKALS